MVAKTRGPTVREDTWLSTFVPITVITIFKEQQTWGGEPTAPEGLGSRTSGCISCSGKQKDGEPLAESERDCSGSRKNSWKNPSGREVFLRKVFPKISPKCAPLSYHQKGFGGEVSVGTGFLPQAFSETLTMNFQ